MPILYCLSKETKTLSELYLLLGLPKSKQILEVHDWYNMYSNVKCGVADMWIFPWCGVSTGRVCFRWGYPFLISAVRGCTYITSSPEGGGPFVKMWQLMTYFKGGPFQKLWKYDSGWEGDEYSNPKPVKHLFWSWIYWNDAISGYTKNV